MTRELRHERADGVARLRSEILQGKGEQRRGRGLAVHAGHADAALTMDERSQQQGATRQRNLQSFGGLKFRIVQPDGGRISDKDRMRRRELFGVMTEMNGRAAFRELTRLFVRREIRTHHTKAEVEQQMRQPTHAAAADADEINRRARRRRLQQLTKLG